MADNKVVFGLRNAHYSIITEGEGGEITYGVPVALKGAVEISLDPRGKQRIFMLMIFYIIQLQQTKDMKQL